MIGDRHITENVNDSSNRYFHIFIAALLVHIIGFVGLFIFSDNLSEIVVGVYLVTLIILPIVGYLDIREVHNKNDWDPPRVRWLVGFAMPFLSASIGIAYILRRQQHIYDRPRRSQWITITGVVVGILFACIFVVGSLESPPSGNTLFQDILITPVFILGLVPGATTYYDLSYLSDSSHQEFSRFDVLWTLGMTVIVLQVPLYVIYWLWRRQFLEIESEIKQAEEQYNTAISHYQNCIMALQTENPKRALEGLEDTTDSIEEIKDIITEIEGLVPKLPPRVERVVTSVDQLQDSVESQRTHANGLQQLSKGRSAYENDDYELVIETLQNAEKQLETALSASDEPNSIRDAIEETNKLRERALDTFITKTLKPLDEEIEAAYTSGCKAFEADEYTDALENFGQAEDRIERFTGLVDEYDIDRDPLIDITTIEQKRKAIARERVQSEIEDVTTSLDNATEAVEAGQNQEAIESLYACESTLTKVQSVGEEYEFEDISARAEELHNRHSSLMDTARSKVGDVDLGVSSVNSALSIEYDALESKEQIGSGGNADVYRARVTTPDGRLPVAIKEPRMSGTLHTEMVEGILEEAETWDKLDDHDHIVDLIDYGSDPLPWIAMEYMDGGPLDDRAGQLNINQSLWTAIAVTKAVRHAHRRGIAHLDLKPDNVLFQTVEDAWDVPKVADWGLSKQLLDHSKSVEGLSPHYAAPEQFDDDYGAADDLTDIYQVGAILYELFTGQQPFDGTPAEVMNKVLNETPVPPTEIADIPPEMDDILLTAMAKKKTDRYEDLLFLRNELQDLYSNYE